MTQDSEKKRTIFILFVPGGAMLGIIPWVVLNRLEELTETPPHELFQAFEGVSSGSLIVAGQNIPGMTTAMSLEAFCEKAPASLPDMPGRHFKMITSQIIDAVQDNLNPERADSTLIIEIESLCQSLKDALPAERQSEVQNLQKIATQKWLTKSRQAKLYRQCEKLAAESPALEDIAGQIGELVWARSSSNRLGNIFKKATLGSLDFYRNRFATPDKYLFNPQLRKNMYMEQFGERRMSECLRSIYISAYDANNHKVKTFYSRKPDFFNPDPEEPAETSEGDHKIWDALMASTANPFGFPPHRTEDGTLCIDKAVIHPPFAALQDVLAHKPEDADVKLVILGTGKHLKKLPAHSADEYYLNKGVIGNFLNGREISEAEAYIMDMSYQMIETLLGPDHIIEISPEFNTEKYSESLDIPSQDSLNGSEDYKRKTLKQARSLLVREDERIRELAQMLIDNLHLIGQMDEEKYQHISQKIGITAHNEPLKSGIGKELTDAYDKFKRRPDLKELFGRWASGIWKSKKDNRTERRALPPRSENPAPKDPPAPYGP